MAAIFTALLNIQIYSFDGATITDVFEVTGTQYVAGLLRSREGWFLCTSLATLLEPTITNVFNNYACYLSCSNRSFIGL